MKLLIIFIIADEKFVVQERNRTMGVNIEKVFGENVFDDAVMKVRLPNS